MNMDRQKIGIQAVQSRLRVFMAPTFHGFNKYGPALVRSIRQEGIDVRFMSEWTPVFPFLAMIRTIGLPDIVHLHWIDIYTIKKTWWRSLLASMIFFIELLLLKILGIKIVWTVHDHINPEGKFGSLDISIRRLTAKFSDSIIVHTEAASQEVTKLYNLPETEREKIRIIYCGHFIGQYPNILSQTESREKLGLDKDMFLFGFIGYVRPYKGIVELIKTFRQIDNHYIHLLIAGLPFDVSFANVVKEAARGDSRIHLYLKFIEDEEIQIFLNAVNVVVLPYTRSLTSAGLILAMSFSKAVVASDFGTIREVLPAEGGLVYASEDPEELVRALREIQTKDVISMGKKNLKRAQAFDWPSIGKTTSRVYHEVTRRSVS
jgi:beta-1,4-mannosyltransferase